MKGIIFTEPNFHLSVQGIKKQTRRIIKPQPDNIRSFNRVLGNTPDYELSEKPWTPEPAYHFLMHEGKYLNPRYKVGEIVYLKEPYAYAPIIEEQKDIYPHDDFIYRYGHKYMSIKWKNKLFMPEIAARYFIKITGVRAEKLQDISDEDCIKEGIVSTDSIAEDVYEPVFENGLNATDKVNAVLNIQYETPQKAYKALINKINGKDTWDNNPWVWVYDYELKKEKN